IPPSLRRDSRQKFEPGWRHPSGRAVPWPRLGTGIVGNPFLCPSQTIVKFNVTGQESKARQLQRDNYA
ncbi:hypothetical protein J6590_093629, partial [Homalodisca vitripennis]